MEKSQIKSILSKMIIEVIKSKKTYLVFVALAILLFFKNYSYYIILIRANGLLVLIPMILASLFVSFIIVLVYEAVMEYAEINGEIE